MKCNYTHTVNIPSSAVPYEAPATGWDSAHYNAHYEKEVKPVFEAIRVAVDKIANSQPNIDYDGTVKILWNKCRYFELSCYDKDIRRFVAQSAKVKVVYNNMLCGNRFKLEAVVKAFNKKKIYCKIEQNWI